jgi:hypothetical protein
MRGKWRKVRGHSIDWALLDCDKAHVTPGQLEGQDDMLAQLDYLCYNRRMFRTGRDLMGLGPSAQVGDDVCVLLGGSVLYVLRDHHEGQHEFVGECYVHAMMNGQACEEPWFTKKTFVLL